MAECKCKCGLKFSSIRVLLEHLQIVKSAIYCFGEGDLEARRDKFNAEHGIAEA